MQMGSSSLVVNASRSTRTMKWHGLLLRGCVKATTCRWPNPGRIQLWASGNTSLTHMVSTQHFYCDIFHWVMAARGGYISVISTGYKLFWASLNNQQSFEYPQINIHPKSYEIIFLRKYCLYLYEFVYVIKL